MSTGSLSKSAHLQDLIHRQDMRVGTLEAGHGWLPFWMARLDEHAQSIKAALPEFAHKPSEYVIGGRYFQSIEIPEGAPLTNAVIDLVGDHVLMYASDYPHRESHFPESVSLVLDWETDEERKRPVLRTRSSLMMSGYYLGETPWVR